MRSILGSLPGVLLLAAFFTVGTNTRLKAQPVQDSVILRLDYSGGNAGQFGWTPIMMRSTRLLAGISVPFKIEGTSLIIDSVSAAHSIAGPYLPFINYFSPTTKRGFIRFLPDFNGHEFTALNGELFRVWWHIPPEAPEAVAVVDTCFYIIGVTPSDTVYALLDAADWGLHTFKCSFISGGITVRRYECGDIGGDLYWASSAGNRPAATMDTGADSGAIYVTREFDAIDISDAYYLVNYIFLNGTSPLDKSYGDVNCDGMANINDVVYLVNFIFNSGPNPCANCPSD